MTTCQTKSCFILCMYRRDYSVRDSKKRQLMRDVFVYVACLSHVIEATRHTHTMPQRLTSVQQIPFTIQPHSLEPRHFSCPIIPLDHGDDFLTSSTRA